MVWEMLQPMREQIKIDQTNYTAIMKKGVPQGAPSFPVLFIMYMTKKCIDSDTWSMVRAILGPMRVQTKSDPTNYTDIVTRGVPQGAPSSSVLLTCI